MILEINGWETNIKFSASHFIPYHGKCSRLHGHDYGIRVRIEGEMDENHMVMDFIELKSVLREIADSLDHHILLPKKSSVMSVEEIEARVVVSFEDKEYIIPIEDVCYIDVEVPTAEELSKFFMNELLKRLKIPENVKRIEICVDEGLGQGACSEVMITR